MLRSWIAIALTLSSLIMLGSCVERKERLTIMPNGGVYYRVEHRSMCEKTLYEDDAVPRPASGWIVAEDSEKDDEGGTTYRFIAERLFAPGEPLPGHFALRTDPNADLYLQFPTAVRIERRRDGIYYHFSRTYPARAWAHIEALEDRLVRQPLQEVSNLELGEWTAMQRLEAVRALTRFETEKMLLLARAAVRQALPELPQDAWLDVRSHVRDCVHHYDYQKLANDLQPREKSLEEDQRGEAVLAEIRELVDLTADQIKQAMFTVANCSGAQLNAFTVEFDRQMKAYTVTQKLGSHRLEIEVEMPGEIIASNADSVSGRTAKWEIEGTMLRDREIELLATSRVGNERRR